MTAAILILLAIIVLCEMAVLFETWAKTRYRIVRRMCGFTFRVQHHGIEPWTCWLWWSWRPLTDAERRAA